MVGRRLLGLELAAMVASVGTTYAETKLLRASEL